MKRPSDLAREAGMSLEEFFMTRITATVTITFTSDEPETEMMDSLTADLFKLGDRYDWVIARVETSTE